ncbi:hypothetical protein ABZY81_43190 [Streptomyces sp. NPDC006514]|uniref:hypothetical protein n=1 Tax=Streptomyces sp. NPDC006514 TaxID=3154308 RepID=UPI0033BF9568
MGVLLAAGGAPSAARGQVDLTGANVDGPLIAGGRIYHAEQEALILDSVTTAQDVLFEQGMLVEGSLCMRAADVGSNLKIEKPNLSRGQADVALTLEGTTIKGTLLLRADTDAPVSFFELATDRVMVVKRNERGPRAVDRDI